MFRKRIQNVYANLSPNNQRVARYILDHYHEAAFMSANQLGMLLDVDAATIVRFAQRVGYSGYTDLLEALRKAVQQDLHRARTAPTDPTDMTSTTLAALDMQINSIQAMRASLDQTLLSQALERILNANRIYVMGEGVSSRLADLGAYGLRVIGLDAVTVEPTVGDALAVFMHASQDDVMVAIVITELAPQVTNAVRTMREWGVPTVGIVGALYWPVVQWLDIALVAPIESVTFFTNFAATAALINAMGEGLLVRQGAWMVERARGLANMAQVLMGIDAPVGADAPGTMVSRIVANRDRMAAQAGDAGATEDNADAAPGAGASQEATP